MESSSQKNFKYFFFPFSEWPENVLCTQKGKYATFPCILAHKQQPIFDYILLKKYQNDDADDDRQSAYESK